MIALPSIAFGGFSGSAKGVTARQVGGRSVLSLKCFPTGYATAAQLVRRGALSKISKAYKNLSAGEIKAWENLAEHSSGQSVFGQKAKISAHNLFVRLNTNRAYCGEDQLLEMPPASLLDIPVVAYDDWCLSEDQVVFTGVPDPEGELRLVAKMTDGQSSGVSNAWSKTVIISPDKVPDWGDIDLTEAFAAVMGHSPINGQKYFVELYWIDPATGFTGVPVRVSGICQEGSQITGEAMGRRMLVKKSDLDTHEYDHFDDFSMEFAPGSTIMTIDAAYNTGDYNVAAAKANISEKLSNMIPDFRAYVAGRRNAGGLYWPCFWEVNKWRWAGKGEINCSNRGGHWERTGLIFGTGPATKF